MNTVTDNPVEIADAAMKYEQQGYKIICDAKDKATHPLSKATFEFLAEQELHHIEAIKEFARSLAGECEFDADKYCKETTKAEAGEQIKGIFSKFKEEFEAVGGKEELDERLETYSVALEMERVGHDFYKKSAEQSTDEKAKRFYNYLADEEVKHFEIIQETREYLKQPDAIMAAEERWMQF